MYARRKNGHEPVTYTDNRLEPILAGTQGVYIYQEQAMQIAKDLAGFSPAQADDLRKAIGKKNAELMATLKDEFLEGCVGNGVERKVAEHLWAENERSADYSFNKAHAACYALIAYRTAYLKANHPAEYMAALISSVMDTKDRVPFYVAGVRGDGDRRAAARRQRVRARLRGARRQDPLRPVGGQERRRQRRARDRPRRATRAARSTPSGTSASASTGSTSPRACWRA